MIRYNANLDARTMRILNQVKKEQGFKDISGALNYIATVYEAELLDPEFKPPKKKR